MFLRYVLPVLLLSPIVDARGELLGDASGRVLLGRPLDIVVQSSSSSLLGGRQGCVQAKVRYGDVPVPDADVQVSIETPSERGAGQGRIRVRVKRPLDEPFVSLTVAVGCGGQEGVFRREWVLLADWPASVGGGLGGDATRRRCDAAWGCRCAEYRLVGPLSLGGETNGFGRWRLSSDPSRSSRHHTQSRGGGSRNAAVGAALQLEY